MAASCWLRRSLRCLGSTASTASRRRQQRQLIRRLVVAGVCGCGSRGLAAPGAAAAPAAGRLCRSTGTVWPLHGRSPAARLPGALACSGEPSLRRPGARAAAIPQACRARALHSPPSGLKRGSLEARHAARSARRPAGRPSAVRPRSIAAPGFTDRRLVVPRPIAPRRGAGRFVCSRSITARGAVPAACRSTGRSPARRVACWLVAPGPIATWAISARLYCSTDDRRLAAPVDFLSCQGRSPRGRSSATALPGPGAVARCAGRFLVLPRPIAARRCARRLAAATVDRRAEGRLPACGSTADPPPRDLPAACCSTVDRRGGPAGSVRRWLPPCGGGLLAIAA